MAQHLFAGNIIYSNRRLKGLIVLRPRINKPYDIHSPYNFSKSGISLSVRVIVTPVIESRLVAHANKKLGSGRSGSRPCQGDGPVLVKKMGLLCRFVGDTVVGYGLLIIGPPDTALYQFGFGSAGGLVVIVE